jgi:hypothetical protein
MFVAEIYAATQQFPREERYSSPSDWGVPLFLSQTSPRAGAFFAERNFTTF